MLLRNLALRLIIDPPFLFLSIVCTCEVNTVRKSRLQCLQRADRERKN